MLEMLSTTNTSKSIEFENIKVSDFILNKSNRVLSIDDIIDIFLNENSEDLIDLLILVSGLKVDKLISLLFRQLMLQIAMNCP